MGVDHRLDDLKEFHLSDDALASIEAYRARAAAKAAKTAHRRVPMNPVEPGHCRWCERPIIAQRGKHIGKPDPRRSWCRAADPGGRRCYRDFLLHSDQGVQSDYLAEARGRRCTECGEENPERWRSQGEAHMLDWSRGSIDRPWLRELWNRDDAPDCRWLGLYVGIERVSALEVDHVIPLWKVALKPIELRRPFFGPEFLQLLCSKCHKAKTAEEAKERAAIRAAGRAASAAEIAGGL